MPAFFIRAQVHFLEIWYFLYFINKDIILSNLNNFLKVYFWANRGSIVVRPYEVRFGTFTYFYVVVFFVSYNDVTHCALF